jgi:predicted RNA-binding protein YlxR (DUF448 family)
LPRQEPERTCIVTREPQAPGALIRFVLGPDNQVVPDLRHKLPGRGAWVTARADLVETAVKRRLFSRAFKTEAKAAATLAQDIDAALLADLRQALALANKAGAVVTGFTKVEAAIAAEKSIAALVHAAEAADDGRRKLAGALRKRFGDAISGLPVIDVLPGAELDLALGRSHVIHAGLVAGAGSDGFLMRWHRLCAYRGATGADQAGYPQGAGEPDDFEDAGSETLNE